MSANEQKEARFSLGQVVATPGAVDVMKEEGIGPVNLLSRHVCGDWGDVCNVDRASNQAALRHGDRLLSVYVLEKTRTKVWVITEADRSSTAILLPEEY